MNELDSFIQKKTNNLFHHIKPIYFTMKKIPYLLLLLAVALFVSACDLEPIFEDPDEPSDCEETYDKPVIELSGTEEYATTAGNFLRFTIPVTNYTVYDDSLFSPASDLPPCGLNNNSARSWVDIYDQDDNRIYGFCALGEAASLQDIWFSVPEGVLPPQKVCVKIHDRACDKLYVSDKIDILCPDFPTPVLSFSGTEEYTTSGGEFVRYRLPVTNFADYFDFLFDASPDLDPCGLNTDASRTWVDIYDQDDNRLYGFCALGEASSLQNIWFSLRKGTTPPRQVYIKLNDRRCNRTVTSNSVSL